MATGRSEHPPELADRPTDAEADMLAKLFFCVCAGILSLAAAVLTPVASAEPPVFLLKWGTLGSGDGQFNAPHSLAVDGDGNVYVVDRDNHRIQKFTSDGTYLTQWGGAGTGNGQFDHPYGVAADASGNIYVADEHNSRIQKFTSSGTYLTQWGSWGSGSGQFNHPEGVAVDGAGNVYVTEQGNSRVQKFTSDGTYLTQWGAYGSGDGQFVFPYGVVADGAGYVYVADTWNNRIQKFTSDGTFQTKWGSNGSASGQFILPYGLTADASGRIYVADYGNNRIQMFAGDGTYLTKWGTGGSGNGQFNAPHGVAVAASGNVYVADTGNNRVQAFAWPSYSIPELYAQLPGNLGNQVRVEAYFTNPADSLLVKDFAAYEIDSLLPIQDLAVVDDAGPPDATWYGARIVVIARLDTFHVQEPYSAEDSVCIMLRDVVYDHIVTPSECSGGGVVARPERRASETSVAACDPCKFALMMAGSANVKQKRYWNNLVTEYRLKTETLGFCPDNIFVLYKDGRPEAGNQIPASALRSARKVSVSMAQLTFSIRMMACRQSGKEVTFEWFVTDHGNSLGNICLYQGELLTPQESLDMLQAFIDAGATAMDVDLVQCYAGQIASKLKELDRKGRTSLHVFSEAGQNTRSFSNVCPADGGWDVYPRKRAEALEATGGADMEGAVLKGQLDYETFLREKPWRSESKLKSIHWDGLSMKEYCEWHKVVVPPGGQLLLRFSGSGTSCGNCCVWEDMPDGHARKRAVWNWNVPGSARFETGNDLRVLNVDQNSTGVFWLHNDDGAYEVIATSVHLRGLPESPSNASLYPGFSAGGDDQSALEFRPIAEPYRVVQNVDQPGVSLGDLPREMGPGRGVEDLIVTFTNSGDEYWNNMELVIDAAEVFRPGVLDVHAPSDAFHVQVPMATPGRYVVPLGRVSGDHVELQALGTNPNRAEFSFDCWGLRTRVEPVDVPADAPNRALRMALEFVNPYAPGLPIRLLTDRRGRATVVVYDIGGRVVATLLDEVLAPGEHTVTWDARGLSGRTVASGVYFYRLSLEGRSIARRVALLK
ncbi:MAG: hypothetical protein A2V88_09335 [Elusimicrobia bacterium RBG_16_66_12]|nr:MAG: hypothetical protein A2V88_09335 [Elusimicrobia bacterium RBG_16_66_12]